MILPILVFPAYSNDNTWSLIGSTVVIQLPHHPKVKGLSLAPTASTGKRNWCHYIEYHYIIKRVSWFKSSLLLRIQSDSFTNINS